MLDQFVHLFPEFALATAHYRGQHHDTVFRSQRHYPLYDLFRRLTRDGAAALGAMGSAN